MKVNRLGKLLIIIIIIVAIIGGIVIKLSSSKKKVVQVKKDVPIVKVQKPSIQSISTEVQYASKLKAIQEVTISGKNSGKVTAVNVAVGSNVSAGQVLFTLDSSELSAQLQQQQASLDSSNVNLQKTEGSALTQQIITASQTVDKSKLTYNDTSDAYNRAQTLYAAGTGTKQSVDDAKLKLDNASVDLTTAQDNLTLLKQKSGPQSVQVAEAQVAQSEASVNYVRTQIDNSVITSPISGVVSAKNVDIGEIASASSTVTIIDSSVLIAELSVPDKIIGKCTIGETVPVVVNALGDKSINGIIDSISPDADSKSNAYIIKVKIDNSNGALKSGMFAKISLPNEKKDNVLTVPNEALKGENGTKFLYTISSGKIKKVAIDTGIASDKFTEILGKLDVDTELVIEGQSLLSDGEAVKVAK